jgi:uncharacterized protein Yka (UPF0111/DUF47 family)
MAHTLERQRAVLLIVRNILNTQIRSLGQNVVHIVTIVRDLEDAENRCDIMGRLLYEGLYRVDVDSAAQVSEVHAASVFRVYVCR